MNIAELKEDLEKRQKMVVEEINQVVTQVQSLESRRQELFQEALRLNGEARLIQRLSKDGEKEPE